MTAPDAEKDVRTCYHYIRDRAPQAAKKWLRELRSSIKTLSHFPERCPMASESSLLQKPIRQLFFGAGNRGTYRILFIVNDKSVNILHVRHGSMLPIGSEEYSEE